MMVLCVVNGNAGPQQGGDELRYGGGRAHTCRIGNLKKNDDTNVHLIQY